MLFGYVESEFRKVGRLVLFGLAWSAAPGYGLGGGASGTVEACERYDVTGLTFSRVTSGVVDSRDRLVLADPLSGGLWRFGKGPPESSLGDVQFIQHQSSVPPLYTPGKIMRSEPGSFLALEPETGRLVRLNSVLEPVTVHDLNPRPGNMGFGVLQWSVTETTAELYGFGYAGTGESWQFFRADRPRKQGEKAKADWFDIDLTKAAQVYLLTFPLAAGFGESVVFFYGGTPPRLLSLDSSGHELLPMRSPRIAKSYGGILPTGRGGVSVASAHETLKELYSYSTPVQFLGHESRLYVLFRQSVADGWQWRLVTLSKESHHFVETDDQPLPSKAMNVTLVRGTGFWYLVEKGEDDIGGAQAILGVVRISDGWFDEQVECRRVATVKVAR